MAVKGPQVLLDLALPTGVDGTRIFQWQRRDNVTGQQLVERAAQVIGVVNERLLQTYGGMVRITDSLFSIVRQGETSRSMTPAATELGEVDPVKSDTIGSMLPIEDYEDKVAWSERYLRDASMMEIDATLQLISERWENRVDYGIWTRALTNTENAIGSAGYDVPWANGTAGNVDYVPPQWMGEVFASSHTHFLAEAGGNAAAFQSLFVAMMLQLRHHGHRGTLSIFCSDDDVSTIRQTTGFVQLFQPGTLPTNNNSAYAYATGTIDGVPGEVFGYFDCEWGRAELRFHYRIPQYYAFGTKTYGINNARNGLALRIHPAENGFGMMLKPVITWEPEQKISQVRFVGTHGIGVNDRVNGVAGYANNATWSNPTIS